LGGCTQGYACAFPRAVNQADQAVAGVQACRESLFCGENDFVNKVKVTWDCNYVNTAPVLPPSPEERATNSFRWEQISVKHYDRGDGRMELKLVMGAIKSSMAAIVTTSAIAFTMQ